MADGQSSAPDAAAPDAATGSSTGRVLVTGAGGFIGGRVVEHLHLGAARPIAAMRRWSTAPRLARFGVEIRLCDLLRRDRIADALEDADAIVHCAVGSPEVTIEGTRNLLAAAETRGIRRIVFLSTIEVYGRASGTVREDDECRPRDDYGRSKLEAEALCEDFGRRGGEVVILRPAIVYGPFSRWWTQRVAERLVAGQWAIFPEVADGVCNLIYIDDLVRCIRLCLESEEAVGQVFHVNGPEAPTWNEYARALNAGLGLPPLEPRAARQIRGKSLALAPLRKTAELGLRFFEKQIFGLYERFPPIRGPMRLVEQALRGTPAGQELELYARDAYYDPSRCRELLGFEASTGMAEGVEISCRWLRHHGFVGASAATPERHGPDDEPSGGHGSPGAGPG